VINFVFEDSINFKNFIASTDVNRSGINTFAASPIAVIMLQRTQMASLFNMKNKPKPYIIATGVNHHPSDWIGLDKLSPFSFLNKKQLKDVQNNKAMILFDQSLEGYQTLWLWERIHTECANYSINPNCIIYVTGNLLAEEQYTEWANINNIINFINVIPYTHFEADVANISQRNNINCTFEKQITYKFKNDILSFNCLQKRLRNHRIWFYIRLFEEDLLKHGLVSMNPYSPVNIFMDGKSIESPKATAANKSLPLLLYGKNNNEHPDDFYITRIQDNVFLDSWVSVISEASFADCDNELFLSEKIFKPIACHHPFIIFGNKNSLHELRKMGYKTFNGFIDESYDTLPTFERLDAIIESIKKIIAIKDKTLWYNSMKEILVHNYNTLISNSQKINPAIIQLENAYTRYFKLHKNA